MVSEDSGGRFGFQSFLLIDRTCRIFTALNDRERVAQDTTGVSSIWPSLKTARFLPLSHACSSRITAGIDYTFTLFLGAGVLWRFK
jgi:hypothetical protein